MSREEYAAQLQAHRKRSGRATLFLVFVTLMALAIQLQALLRMMTVYHWNPAAVLTLALLGATATLAAYAQVNRKVISRIKEKHGPTCSGCGMTFFGEQERELLRTGHCPLCGSPLD